MNTKRIDKVLPPTATTTDLGIGLNEKLVLYLGNLANPNNGLT